MEMMKAALRDIAWLTARVKNSGSFRGKSKVESWRASKMLSRNSRKAPRAVVKTLRETELSCRLFLA